MLTPQAVAQIRQSGKAFAPPGLETAGFELGHVRKTSPAKAIVQCFLSDAANDRRAREEMCCILREVEGRWLVSGIAFQISPQHVPLILDFEKPAQSAQSNQPLVGGGSDGQANPPAAAAGGSPVRTAQDPSVPPGR